MGLFFGGVGGVGRGSVPSHGVVDPSGVFAEVDVDAGFLGVPADSRTPRDDALKTSVANEGSPGIALMGGKRGGCYFWGGQGGGGSSHSPVESLRIGGRSGL